MNTKPEGKGETRGAKERLLRNVTTGIDEVIREAINSEIGEEWTLAEMKGRLKSLRFRGQPFETFTLDDKPILELWPVEMKTETRGGSIHMVATRKYRTFSQNASIHS